MPATVAFSHKGGFWKTRYSFFSYCYAFIDRIFLSFNTVFTNQPVWEHDRGGTNTSFYGGGADGSAIAVSFNENVSSNKIYKSFSLESTNNVTGVSVLTVNNSTVGAQAKNITATVLQEKGGIMYGGVGHDQRLTGANVKAVGSVLGGVNADIGTYLSIEYIDGGTSYNLSEDDPTRFFFGYYPPDGADVIYFDLDFNSPIAIPNNYFEDFTALTLAPTVDFGNGVTSGESVGTNYIVLQGGDITLPIDGSVILYSVSPGYANGEAARGQFVDAIVTLGAADYELYALNLEYEETNYDHRDERVGTRARRATQRRKRRR